MTCVEPPKRAIYPHELDLEYPNQAVAITIQ